MQKNKLIELIVCIIAVIALIITTNSFAATTDVENLSTSINGNNTNANASDFENIPDATGNNINTNSNLNNTNVNNNITNNSTNKNANTNKNTTVMPDTGVDYSVLFIIAVFGVIAVYAYKKIKDYKNI